MQLSVCSPTEVMSSSCSLPVFPSLSFSSPHFCEIRCDGTCPSRHQRLICNAGWLDNFGKSNEEAKDEAFRQQQEILKARRAGKALDKAIERRSKLKKVAAQWHSPSCHGHDSPPVCYREERLSQH